MAYYNSGTATFTSNSAIVQFTNGANLITGKVEPGFVLFTPNFIGIIKTVDSATQLTMEWPYSGGTGPAAYSIEPSQGVVAKLSEAVRELLTRYGGIADGIGAGLFPDGSAAAPGIRFAADQDTGIYRFGTNAFGFVTGGVMRGCVTAVGNIGIGTSIPYSKLEINGGPASIGGPGASNLGIEFGDIVSTVPTGRVKGFIATGDSGSGVAGDLLIAPRTDIDANIRFFSGISVAERMRIDGTGNILVGTAANSCHTIAKGEAEGGIVLQVTSALTGQRTMQFNAVGGAGFGAAASATYIGLHTATSRSINAGGTINASGADYAEYVRKADGCGEIAKADVCGINRDGLLTKSWADAVRYVVKSTDPNLVGGDSWGRDVGERPVAPAPLVPEPKPPVAPEPFDQSAPEQGEYESEGEFWVCQHIWQEAKDAADASAAEHAQRLAAFPALHANWVALEQQHIAATTAHEAALAEWEVAFEAVRQKVDRIAFCGQTPVNVHAGTLAACEDALDNGEAVYLVAVANGGGIAAQAVREADMTLPLYMKRLGAVWRIEDGRPVIDVQHG